MSKSNEITSDGKMLHFHSHLSIMPKTAADHFFACVLPEHYRVTYTEDPLGKYLVGEGAVGDGMAVSPTIYYTEGGVTHQLYVCWLGREFLGKRVSRSMEVLP